VGVMVDSCRECHFCKHHEEQYCEAGLLLPTMALINIPATTPGAVMRRA
jgi:D-arabinose 1-dehydrogenase-like Zn-dependent alcohol dehydrogenase